MFTVSINEPCVSVGKNNLSKYVKVKMWVGVVSMF